jgi:hypothetical protein
MKSIFFDPTGRGSDGQAQVSLGDADRAKPGVWPVIILALMASVASAQTRIDLRTQAKSVDFSAAGSTKPSKMGAILPASCSVGETFLKTDATAGQNFYVCTAANVWTLQGAVIPTVTGMANTVLATDGTALVWKALVGDASGAPGALTVSKLQGRPVASSVPTGGQALTWNSSAMQWEPQTSSFGQISGTINDGQLAAGINASKIAGGSVSNTIFGYLTNVNSDLQTQLNGKSANTHTHTVAGDVGGSLGSLMVTGLQGRAISTTAPANGQVLVWNSGASQWQPQAGAGAVSTVFGRTGVVTAQSGDYSFSQISGAVTDSQVGAGISAAKLGAGTVGNTAFGHLANVTSDLQTQLNSKVGAASALTGDLSGTLASTIVSGIQSRAISATAPKNGQVLAWNAMNSRWEPQNASAAGAGGYSASFTGQTMVTIPGVTHQLGTANVQVGCYDTSTVPNARVQPNSVAVNPSNFDVTITFVAVQTGRCVVTAGGGGAGGGASMASQLGDLGVLWTSATVLTVGPNCSSSVPCNVRLGSNVVRFINPAMVTLTGGTGAAYVYIDQNGVLTVGHNLTLSCTAPCTAVSGVNSFPLNSLPLYSWSASGGSWDTTGGIDKRAVLSTKLLTAGTGIVTLESGSSTNVSVDAAVVPQYLTATGTLSFGAISNASCAGNQTFTLTGAVVGDAVAPGWPSGFPMGLVGNMWVSEPNTVAVRMCNFSGSTVTPASATYRGMVVKGF